MLCVEWSPDGGLIASGGMDSEVKVIVAITVVGGGGVGEGGIVVKYLELLSISHPKITI